MLENFIINIIDTFNIVYLYTTLTKRNNRNIFKLLLWGALISILVTITEELGFNFIIISITSIIIIKFTYEENLKEAILELFLAFLINITFKLNFSIVINRFINNYIFQAIFTEFIILIGILIFSKLKLLKINSNFRIKDNSVLIYLISIFSLYSILFKFIWSYDEKIIRNNLFFNFLIISVLIISQILIHIYIVKIIKEKEKFKISNKYNAVINEIVEEIKRRQHDFANYKNTIKGIVEVLDEKEIKPAIINYIKDEEMSDDNINNLIYIDNVVIKSIIYRNICRAKKYNINLKYEIENDVLENILNYYEISTLLSNLLNNAFDEVINNDCNKKHIEVKIFSKIDESHLSIKNQITKNNDTDLNKIFEKGYSTKEEVKRGYGLYNVQETVNLHKGHIKVNLEAEVIIFDICFNNS
ncbi:GHKL domain-containing protein [Clostridium botulinum]|nr:GHKL domain-containing protein [Clostridium botulinum]